MISVRRRLQYPHVRLLLLWPHPCRHLRPDRLQWRPEGCPVLAAGGAAHLCRLPQGTRRCRARGPEGEGDWRALVAGARARAVPVGDPNPTPVDTRPAPAHNRSGSPCVALLPTGWSASPARPARKRPRWAAFESENLEATVGFEPTIRVLQTPALTTWLRRPATAGAEEGI